MITVKFDAELSEKPLTEKDLKNGCTYFGAIRGFYEGLFLITEECIVVLTHKTTAVNRTATFAIGKDAVNVIRVHLNIQVTPC